MKRKHNNDLEDGKIESFVHDRYIWEQGNYRDEERKQDAYLSKDPDGSLVAFILAKDTTLSIDDTVNENAMLFTRDFGREENNPRGVFSLQLALDLGEDHVREYMTDWEEFHRDLSEARPSPPTQFFQKKDQDQDIDF